MTVPVIVTCIVVVACVFDVRTRRIPNVLTLSGAVAGLLYHLATSGLGGLQTAAAGWMLGLLLLLPYFALGGMGGGDVKLVAALGAWLGPWETFWLAMYAGIAGGVLGSSLPSRTDMCVAPSQMSRRFSATGPSPASSLFQA
jgi:prepilin peptidase CpaA